MFPLESTLVNTLVTAFFSAVCFLTVLGFAGMVMDGNVLYRRSFSTYFFVFLFMFLPWLGLYISVSHGQLLRRQNREAERVFE